MPCVSLLSLASLLCSLLVSWRWPRCRHPPSLWALAAPSRAPASAPVVPTATTDPTTTVSALPPGPLATTQNTLPVVFEANAGQTDPRVAFLARGSGYTMFFTGTAITLLLAPPCPSPHVLSNKG